MRIKGIDFNPRSHERSDEKMTTYANYQYISIHAPTRGATVIVTEIIFIGSNFNPRSHERSDTCNSIRPLCIYEFQSTLPREERQGAGIRYLADFRDFNPRSHERSDSNIAQKICLFLYNTDNKYIIR